MNVPPTTLTWALLLSNSKKSRTGPHPSVTSTVTDVGVVLRFPNGNSRKCLAGSREKGFTEGLGMVIYHSNTVSGSMLSSFSKNVLTERMSAQSAMGSVYSSPPGTVQ